MSELPKEVVAMSSKNTSNDCLHRSVNRAKIWHLHLGVNTCIYSTRYRIMLSTLSSPKCEESRCKIYTKENFVQTLKRSVTTRGQTASLHFGTADLEERVL